ncbi:MAG TPA: hypothetical protein P5513_02515 [Candidatus Diapherotrites archaeon]|nr:hypothetical protein [Candidatus Diapherotrites archaeon]
MVDLKKSLTFPFISFKFFIIILILSFLSLINTTMAIISFCLILVIGTGFFGTKLRQNKLEKYDKKTISSILSISGAYLLATIIFLAIEAAVIFIGVLPMYLYGLSNPFADIASYNITLSVFSLILLVFVVFAIFLEILKVVGLVRFFKTKKFSTFFNFKINCKFIFTKDFLVSFLFDIGYVCIYVFGVLLLYGIFGLFMNEMLLSMALFVFLFLAIFFIIGGIYSSINEIITIPIEEKSKK